MDWDGHAERAEARYADGAQRLPDEPAARERQLMRMAAAATGAGLARLMQGRAAESAGWLSRSAERFRESYELASPGSWGRLLGALKARILAGDERGAEADARWTLAQEPAASDSPIGVYAAILALLVLGRDEKAAGFVEVLRAAASDAFPPAVADALAGIAAGDAALYGEAVERVLGSFEERDEYLEGVPVADTVLVLQALAERRGLAAELRSPLLPGP